MPSKTVAMNTTSPSGTDIRAIALPLSEAQRGIWLGQQLHQHSAHYNTAELIEFTGALNRQMLEAAISTVLQMTAPLNTRFLSSEEFFATPWYNTHHHQELTNSDAVQTVFPISPAEIPLTHIDLSHCDKPINEAKRWANEQLDIAIDIGKQPPFRSAIIQLEDGRYAWFLMIHHIACDGFSYSLLCKQVAASYKKIKVLTEKSETPEASSARPLLDDLYWKTSVSEYQKFLIDDNRYRVSEQRATDEKYWLDTLATAAAPITLSALPINGLAFTQRSLRTDRNLSSNWLNRFGHLCQQAGGHWAVGLNALVSLLLFQHTGANELVLGQPVMNRLRSTAIKVPTMVMNIVPLPIKFCGVSTFNALVAQISEQQKRSSPHSRYRYEQLRRQLKKHGDNRRAFGPVVNVMPFDRNTVINGHAIKVSPISAGPVEDIAFSFSLNAEGGIHFLLEANPLTYNIEQLTRYADRLMSLAQQVIKQTEEYAIRVDREICSWLTGNACGTDIEQNSSVLERLSKVINQNGKHTALEYLSAEDNHSQAEMAAPNYYSSSLRTMSYEQLGSNINECARVLLQQGLCKDSCLAIALPRGPWAVVLCFACLAIEAHFIFIDPKGPRERNTLILKDAKPTLVVCDEYASSVLNLGANPEPNVALATKTTASEKNALPPRILPLDLITSFVASSPPTPNNVAWQRSPQATPQTPSLAYCIYTSGSSGQPKGVMIDTLALDNWVTSATDVYNFSQTDRVLQFAPMHFDTSIEEIMLTLCNGGSLIIREESMVNSMSQFNQACEDLRLTVLDLPTAFWHEWVHYCSNNTLSLPDNLQTIIIGGEAVNPERVKDYCQLESQTPVHLLNTYGPTEATIVASTSWLASSKAKAPTSKPTAPSPRKLSIGKPLPNYQLLVLRSPPNTVDVNEFSSYTTVLAPRGEDGELVIASTSLARGYLNNPLQTKASFKTLNFGGAEKALRIYHTGDRARINSQGEVEYLGRIDSEIKISGQRINPAEIEASLLQFVDSREVCVVFVTADSRDLSNPPTIVAYFSGREIDDKQKQQLRENLENTLPPVMLPQQYIWLPELPKTRSGKLDRHRLLDQYLSARKQSSLESTCKLGDRSNSLVSIILRIWQEVLGLSSEPQAPSSQVSEINGDSDFFVMGGQSLQLLKVSARLSTELHADIPITLLFDHPTANGLAAALSHWVDHQTVSTDKGGKTAIKHTTREQVHHNKRQTLPYQHIALPADFPQSISNGIRLAHTRPKSAAILLTGASGFMGVQLLHALLSSTQQPIVCLIRAKNIDHAWKKLGAASTVQALPDVTKNPRIKILLGSIEEPRLGLTVDKFNSLSQGICAVVHNAAITSIVRGYASLKAANVNATIDCLRIAAHASAPFYYISTIAISDAHHLPEDYVKHHVNLHDGYQQSKWAAETLVQQAQQRGHKTTIFRLPRVVGERRTGYINPKDLVWKIIAASQRLGALPILLIEEPWLPVDTAAKIVSATLATEIYPSVAPRAETSDQHNIMNCVPNQKTALNSLFEQLAPRFKDGQVTMAIWVQRLSLSTHSEDQALLVFFNNATNRLPSPSIDTTTYRKALKMYCNPTSEQHQNFLPYINSAEKQGLLSTD